MEKNAYPSLDSYGFIGDCRSSALVSKAGSIDWCCMPIFDSPSCFGRLLDWKQGGFCQISPTESYSSTHRYIDKTMVLETCFETKQGCAKLTDFFSIQDQDSVYSLPPQIIRIIEGISGTARL